MNNETRKKLKGIIQSDVNNMENLALDDPNKKPSVDLIIKESKLINDLEKTRADILAHRKEIKIREAESEAKIHLDKLKFDLELEKVKNLYSIDKDKLSIERDKLDIDRNKISFERDKLELDNNKFELEERRLELEESKFKEDILRERKEESKSRKDKLINIGLRVLEIGLPLVVYSSLVMKNFRLIYADDGRSPSELRDLMKNVNKIKL